MSYVDDLRETIQNTLQLIEDQVRWVEENAPTTAKWLVDEYVSHQPIPHPLKDLLREKLTGQVAAAIASPIVDFARQTREGIAFVRKAQDFIGSPDALRAAADQIDGGVVKPGDKLAEKLVLSNIPSALNANWNDAAATQAYQFKIDGRDDAVRSGGKKASELADGLRASANAIEDFLIALTQTVAGLAGAVAGLVVAIATVATIVVFVGGIIAAVAGVVTAITGIVGLISSTGQNVDEALRGLDPGIDAWPKAFK